MNIKEFLRKILRIFKRKEQDTAHSYPEFKYLPHQPENLTRIRRIRMRYRLRNLPKPGSQASRQDLSKFFKGKGRQAPWYRKQIKQKIKPEEETT